MAASTTRGGLRSSSPNQMKFILVGLLVAVVILGFKHYSRGAEVVELSIELEDAKGRYVTCAANLRKAHGQVAIVEGKLEVLKEQNEQGKKSVEVRETELEKVEKQLNAVTDENNAFETEVESLKINVTKCANQANSLASENDVFRNARDSTDQKFRDLEQQNEDLKTERGRLEKQVEELRRQLAELQKLPTLGSVARESTGNARAGKIEATIALTSAKTERSKGTTETRISESGNKSEVVGPSVGRMGKASGEEGGHKVGLDAAPGTVGDSQVRLDKSGEAGGTAAADDARDKNTAGAGGEGQGQVGQALGPPGHDDAGAAGGHDAGSDAAVGQAPDAAGPDADNDPPAEEGIGGQVLPPDNNRLAAEELLKRGVGLQEGTGDTGPQEMGNPPVQNDNFDDAVPPGDDGDLTDDAEDKVDLPDDGELADQDAEALGDNQADANLQ